MLNSPDLFDPAKIGQYLTINEHNLEDELATCSHFYYLYSDLAADAERIYNESVMELEQYEAQITNDIKSKLISDGNKKEKITESEIKRCYRMDEKWRFLKHKELNSETKFKKLEKAAKAFEMKNQACMSLNKRQLYKASKGMQDLEDI